MPRSVGDHASERAVRFADIRRIALTTLLLMMTACSETPGSLASTVAEAVSLPFKVYADSRSYPGPESIPLAESRSGGRQLFLSCRLVRPLTGSFWGGHADYEADFLYRFVSGRSATDGYFLPPLKSATRDPANARMLCRSQRPAIAASDDGFAILVDGRRVVSLDADGRLVAEE